MKNHSQTDDLVSDIKASLDAGVETLDRATVARLQTARQAALNQEPGGYVKRLTGFLRPSRYALAGLAVASMMLLVTFWHQPTDLLLRSEKPAETMAEHPAADLDILTGEDALELFSDFDFFLWLAERDESHAG